MSLKLEDTENWLYEEGEDQPKQVYIDKLGELKVNVTETTAVIPSPCWDICITHVSCSTETRAANPRKIRRG